MLTPKDRQGQRTREAGAGKVYNAVRDQAAALDRCPEQAVEKITCHRRASG